MIGELIGELIGGLIGGWCNGSTSGFGPDSKSSNLFPPTLVILVYIGYLILESLSRGEVNLGIFVSG